MIVHCPSCSTRYHHSAIPESLLASAHCSECDEVFPLKAPRRRYVLVPTTAGAPRNIGMDDPGLAERTRYGSPELEGSAYSCASHTAPAPVEPTPAWPLVEGDDDEMSLPVGPSGADPQLSGAAGPMGDEEPWTPAAELEGPSPSEPVPEPARSRRRAIGAETLVALAPACAGAGLAYYFAGGTAGSSWANLALGGILGLFVGWGCLRWMRRED